MLELNLSLLAPLVTILELLDISLSPPTALSSSTLQRIRVL